MVWNKHNMPRHSFILWLTVKGRLKTKSMLQRRGIQVSPNCGFCDMGHESIQHLFFECSVSSSIWNEVATTCGIRLRTAPWAVIWRYMKCRCRERSRIATMMRCLLVVTVYVVWVARNRKLFAQEDLDLHSLRNQIVE